MVSCFNILIIFFTLTGFSGNLDRSELVNEIQGQENILQQHVNQLENVEASRLALIYQLKEAIKDQVKSSILFTISLDFLNVKLLIICCFPGI